ncbi:MULTISPECIES: TetR/AcrR family transcriptional regulator [Coprobacillaceae]|uniref:TetR/AcrR family transcriptional regulator n=1 Tax=Coprobacillaceae TaxID=2810280 RepID=UPI000E552ADE|nr:MULTISPECIES: TetR/AcrR family transcriptional regulator C-terminal domain-containing protein [Coprobacillaceae]RHM60484.1 TetR family transcriptional regulator [Coprobacillus sp. AF33-1AC]RHS95815.1 TetR family transcriptional regulator [Erysipelatoclostridium sp. AM42-17]
MNRTEEAIIESFWQLLEEKPFNKITVQNIVERCEVNRNTFYYHFQDIPTLAQQSVKRWVDEVIETHYEFGSPLTCLIPLTEEFIKRKEAFKHLYFSSQRDDFMRYTDHLAYHVVRLYMKQDSHYISISNQEKEMIVHLYKCLLIGIILDWLESDTNYDLSLFVKNICQLFERFPRQ